MKQPAERGILDIRIPVESDEDRLYTALSDYKIWRNQHQGADISYLKSQIKTIPFFEETAISHIRTDIRGKSKTPLQQTPDHLFNTRLFLQFAQEFDLQHREIDQELGVIYSKEENLFKELTGENESGPGKTAESTLLKKDDPGKYMLEERLNAWYRLQAQDPNLSEIFITTSRLVIDYLLDKSPDMEKILQIDSIPITEKRSESIEKWQKSVMDCLESFLGNPHHSLDKGLSPPAISGIDRMVLFSLYRLTDVSLSPFFLQPTAIDRENDKNVDKVKKPRNILICLVTP